MADWKFKNGPMKLEIDTCGFFGLAIAWSQIWKIQNGGLKIQKQADEPENQNLRVFFWLTVTKLKYKLKNFKWRTQNGELEIQK